VDLTAEIKISENVLCLEQCESWHRLEPSPPPRRTPSCRFAALELPILEKH